MWENWFKGLRKDKNIKSIWVDINLLRPQKSIPEIKSWVKPMSGHFSEIYPNIVSRSWQNIESGSR